MQVIQLDPKKILADDNIRYGHTKESLARLRASIIAAGGVNDPVEVEPLEKAQNGYTHRLTVGFGRHAVVSELNAKENAGLTLPAIVRSLDTPLDRLKRQLSENMDRTQFSPIDIAVAARKMLDAGMSRADVRMAFASPTGKKGEMKAKSNSWLNLTLALLDLPKSIQTKVHEGVVGFQAAYELSKYDREKQEAIIAKAEENRAKAREREEKEDEKAAKEEEKAGAKQAKLDEAKAAVETATAEVAETTAKLAAADEAVAAASKVPENYLSLDADARKKIAEKLAAAKTDQRAAKKLADDATKKLEKAQKAYTAVTQPKETPAPVEETQAAKDALENQKRGGKAGAGKKKEVGATDVRKAAKDVGAEAEKPQAMNQSEMRTEAKQLAKSAHRTVAAVFAEVVKLFSGLQNRGVTETNIAVIVGDLKKKKA